MTKRNEEIDEERKFKTKARRGFGVFSLQELGHFARDCSFSCTLCGKLGHCRKQCTRNKNEKTMITFSIRDQELSTFNMYKKTACINDHRATALLDTGSSSCFLKESVDRNLELNILPCKKDLYSFGNQFNPVTQSLGMITVDLQIEEALANNIYVFIVPDSTPLIDLLVGHPFLDLLRIAYARIDEKLRI
ncbi:CCHC-type domain-containing protein [Nephila pilipes]|uniref:CCHC-type domain-containing protein n=1 Tax=Nephila pilipes TaxID=299642 RepID=A0A8X6J0G6_NEPPI|nr:CCHC-type domain-containing protein [Nephila pilipes]